MTGSSSTNMRVVLTLVTDDKTGPGVDSAVKRILGMTRALAKPITIPLKLGASAIRGLRDIQLGLVPLVKGIDSLIERGARIDVVEASFRRLLQENAPRARIFARELQAASNGVIGLTRAQEIANRALAGGLKFDQLKTAIAFISAKAIATGKDVESAIDTVITGLSRGSTLFLDDFGILVDGVESVKRSFDAIKGAGAFDSLAPSAQKAETIRQAIAEMVGQMAQLNISGNETIFKWQGIKTSISDTADRLVSLLVSSKAVGVALERVRDVAAGISKHFAEGGSFKDIFLGANGVPGVIPLLGQALLAGGEAAANYIQYGLLKGAAWLVDELDAVVGAIGDKFNAVVDAAMAITNASETFREGIDTIRNLPRGFTDTATGALGVAVDAGKSAVESIVELIKPGATKPLPPRDPAREVIMPGVGADIRRFFEDRGAGVSPIALPQSLVGDLAKIGRDLASDTSMYRSSRNAAAGGFRTDAARRISALADSRITAGQFGNTDKLTSDLNRFRAAFLPKAPDIGAPRAELDPAAVLRKLGLVPQLTGAKRDELSRDQAIASRQLGIVSRGGGGVTEAAREAAREQIDQLQRSGYRVTPDIRRAVFEEARKAEIARRSDPLEKRLDANNQRLLADDDLSAARRRAGDIAGNDPSARQAAATQINELIASQLSMVTAIGVMIEALTGAPQTLQKAAG